jgi:hypothetical protein
VHNLLELFFDGSSTPASATVALHMPRVASARRSFASSNSGRSSPNRSEQVDEVDLGQVDRHEPAPAAPHLLDQAPADWWSEQWGWEYPLRGCRAAAIAIVSFPRSPVPKVDEQLAENSVSVHEISSDSHVALLSGADTLLLWVDHELAGDAAVDTGEPVNFEEFE